MKKVIPLKRPDLFIVARLFDRLWRENEPMLKTHLQQATGINYDIFIRYLNWMLERDLVKIENSPTGHELIKLTQKGWEAYRQLIQWINEFVNNQKIRK